MDPSAALHLSLAIIWVSGIVTVGAVILLRPLTKQLGSYLEALSEEKLRDSPRLQEERILELLESFEERIERMEVAGDFHRRLESPSLSGREESTTRNQRSGTGP